MAATLDECRAMLVRRWGEMGGYWGINRTMAEIHALLFVSTEPLCTDDIMAQLHISRGNASMNLRGLVDWGLIHREHKLGDRKEYFRADTDVWHMFETITRERRRREVEPILETIHRCKEALPTPGRDSTRPDPGEVREFARRLGELERFLTTMGRLVELVLQFGADGVENLVELTERVADVAPESRETAGPNGKARRMSRNRSSRARSRKAKP